MSIRIASPLFVGRSEELRLLRAALDRTHDGEPRMMLVCGEAGVGKSRLVAQFVDEARKSGAIVIKGASIELATGALAYSPLVSALGCLADHTDKPTREWLSEPARTPLRRLIPEFALPNEQLTPALDTDNRLVLFESTSALLSRVSSDRALVLVVEDLHWADRSTLDLLRYLVSATRNCRLLLVATVRSDETAPDAERAVADFGRNHRVERIDLLRLDWPEIGALIEGIVGVPPSMSLLNRVFERSGGNPFFAEELLAAGPDAVGLTPGLRQVALSRVLDLSEVAQRLVRIVAVAGRPVDHARLEAMSRLAEDELLLHLHESVRGHVLVAEPGSSCYSFRHAVVREVVYEDTLPGERQRLHRDHAEQLRATSPQDPAALAELAYHLDRGQSPAAVLAYVEAAAAAEAVSAYPEALSALERALALQLAATHEPDSTQTPSDLPALRESTARCAHLAGNPQRSVQLMEAVADGMTTQEGPERVAMVHELLGKYLWYSGEVERSTAATRTAYEIARQLPPSPTTARVLTSWARALVLANRFEPALPAARQALDCARAVGARAEEGRALAYMGLCISQTDFDSGMKAVRDAIAISLSVGDIESVLLEHASGAHMSYLRGDFPSLASAIEAALEAVDQVGSALPSALVVLADAAQVYVDTGEWDRAETLIARTTGLGGTGLEYSESRFAAARLAAGRGRWAEATEYLEACWLNDKDVVPQRHAAVRAEILAGQGRSVEARAQVEIGLAQCWSVSAVPYLLEAGLRAEAELAALARLRHDDAGVAESVAAVGRMAAALERVSTSLGNATTTFREYSKAMITAELSRIHDRPDPAVWRAVITVASSGGMHYRTIYPRIRLAEALLQTAPRSGGGPIRTEAGSEIRLAYSFARQIGAQPLVDLAASLAARARISLDVHVDAATVASAEPSRDDEAKSELARLGLSQREIEVLAVLAEGSTNRQIAETLFISEKTAAVHVSRILDKLGAANRVEAAAAAHRLGLRTQPRG